MPWTWSWSWVWPCPLTHNDQGGMLTGWVDARGSLSYFLANFCGEAFPKCHNPVIFEQWTKPRCPIGQDHSQFLPDKYLVAKRLYLNEKYLLRKLLPRDSCHTSGWISPLLRNAWEDPKFTTHSLFNARAPALCWVKVCSSGQQEHIRDKAFISESALTLLHWVDGVRTGAWSTIRATWALKGKSGFLGSWLFSSSPRV